MVASVSLAQQANRGDVESPLRATVVILMPASAQSSTRNRRSTTATTRMSTKSWLRSFISRSSSNKSDENLQQENKTELGDTTMDDGVEILVPSASDVVYKYTWNVRKFGYSLRRRSTPVFDSEAFELNVNGLRTRWNLSIRFWTGSDGTRLQSPVVACLNLLRCYPDDQPGPQATVRFHFGVFCRQSGRYEMTSPARSVLVLGASRHIVSVGHHDVAVLQRHLSPADGDVRLVCKLQVVPTGSDDERHSLSQDLGGLLLEEEEAPCWARGDVMLRAAGGVLMSAHRCILGTRSPRLATLLDRLPTISSGDMTTPPVLELDDLTPDVLQELLRYIYTNRIESIDALAPSLLAAATNYELPGLVALCERNLLETLNSESVAARLLLADEFGCETLKRAALAYCSEGHRMHKNVAWNVMEMVNPELFQEACEAGLCEESSASSFGSSFSDAGSNSR